MKTTISIPAKIADAPDQQKLLERLPIDTNLLNQFVLFDDGLKRAEDYADTSFQTEYGDEVAMLVKQQESLNIEESQQVEVIEKHSDYLETLQRKLEQSDEEKAKPPMSVTTICVQVFIALAIAALLAIGAHNFAILLIKHGEPFLSHPWTAYVTAFSAAAILAAILKSLASLPKRDSIQKLIAGLFLSVGFLSALFYLAILSHMIVPEFSAPTMDNILSGLNLDDAASPSDQINDSFWKSAANKWFLFTQFIAEATGAAGMGYFFARNLKAHRSVHLRNNPLYVQALKEGEEHRSLLKSIQNTLAHCMGFLNVLAHVRKQHIERCVSHVQVNKKVMNMAFHFSGMKSKN